MSDWTHVYTFPKNAMEEVRASITHYNHNPYADIRVFYLSGDQFKPTRKGLTIAPHLLDELIEALMALREQFGSY
ncbi:hypothetical protein JCM16814_04710 [Desulfobaculum senezii]